MGPRNDPAKTIASVLAYATHLQDMLSDIPEVGGIKFPSFQEDLKKYLDILPILSSAAVGGISASDRLSLDTQGTALWNAGTRLMRRAGRATQQEEGGLEKGDQHEEKLIFLCYVKTFAFLLLDSGCAGRKGVDLDIRVLKVSLKTARASLGQLKSERWPDYEAWLALTPGNSEFKQLDLALKVLECAANREEKLFRYPPHAGKDELARKLSMEYHILRVALAWRQDRLDLAEHMFSKISTSDLEKNPSAAENLADLLYEIGNSILGSGQQHLASRWLKRSYDTLSLHGLDAFSLGAGELRLCVLHALVRVNLVLDGDKVVGKSLFDVLQRDYGDKLPAMILKLEVFGKQLNPNYRDFSSCLLSIMKTAQLTDVNFKMILHYTHQLKAWNIESAAEALQYLLTQRLLSLGNDDWIERCVVTFIWMMTASPTVGGGLEGIKAVVETLIVTWRKQLSAAATHGALILIWKRIDVAFGAKSFEVAIAWCRLAQSSIFENAGSTNKAKIQRKLILCGLECSNTALARGSFAELPEGARSDPLTRFLMYKVALKDNDIDLGNECLESLCQLESDGTTYILACVVEAQQSNNKHQAAIVLQRLLDKLNYSPAEGIHLPALLRCTIRLLILEVDADSPVTPDVCEQICTLFECGATHARNRGITSKNETSTLELEWFSRNSYNLALKSCTTWHQGYILRLLNACAKIIDQYPAGIGPEALSDITLRRMFCDFLGAVITVSQARAQDSHELQQESYLNVRFYVQRFRTRIKDQWDRCNPEAGEDLTKKYRILLSFDFEAVVRLQQWDGLRSLVAESSDYADEKLYGVFADIILCSEAPIEETVEVFKTIINSICQKGKLNNTTKLSRWIRCLFQLALDSNVKVAKNVLDQAYALARDHQSSSSAYPEEELEWLATTAFNRAVDFYLESADRESRQWAEKALDLATVMRDGGLKRVLRSKAEELEWDEDGRELWGR